MKAFRAVIFDLDGTLVDNMEVHFLAWEKIAARLGVVITAERFHRDFAGRKNEEIFPQLLQRDIGPAELEALAEEKESTYRALYRPILRPMAGAEALLDRLAANGIALGIASAAPVKNREMVLSGLGWTNRFGTVTGGEGLRGKPAPDIFRTAAERLGVAASDCLAFEDAIHGVMSARNAGMQVCGILSTTPAEVLIEAGATWTARDFSALPPELLELLPG